ncbi:Ribonuclease PH [compost metagenome]
MNVVMTGGGAFVEVQGTGEERPFTRQELDQLLGLGEKGIHELIAAQEEVLGPIALKISSGQPGQEV